MRRGAWSTDCLAVVAMELSQRQSEAISRADIAIKSLAAIALAALTVLASGCSKDQHTAPSPPPTCTIGVNQTSCEVEVMSSSKWIRNYDITSEPQKKVERKVTVITEFHRVDAGTVTWRRSSTVVDAAGNPKTMFIEGIVTETKADALTLKVNRSSCDGVDNSFWIDTGTPGNGGKKLFYKRVGFDIQFRTSPFVEVTQAQGGSGNPFAQIAESITTAVVAGFVQAIVEGMSELMVQTLTLGRARNDLADGAGSFKSLDVSSLVTSGFRMGVVGCFAKSANQSPFVPNSNYR